MQHKSLAQAISYDVKLQDLAVLGGNIDDEMAEYAAEYNVSVSQIWRILRQILRNTR